MQYTSLQENVRRELGCYPRPDLTVEHVDADHARGEGRDHVRFCGNPDELFLHLYGLDEPGLVRRADVVDDDPSPDIAQEQALTREGAEARVGRVDPVTLDGLPRIGEIDYAESSPVGRDVGRILLQQDFERFAARRQEGPLLETIGAVIDRDSASRSQYDPIAHHRHGPRGILHERP